MTLDLIIVSDAKTPELQRMTQFGIDQALIAEKNCTITPIVIEANRDVSYNSSITVYQQGEFNYNKYLNYGAEIGTSRYIAFCNNDLAYGYNWASKLINMMWWHEIDSVSPYSYSSHKRHHTGILPNSGLHYGHTVKHQFEGWCFVWRRELWEQIKLDERVKFWCSDDATAEQLKAAVKSHALVTHAFVEHLDNGGKTLRTVPNRYELTTEQAKIFNRLYDKNVENAGR